FDINLVSPGGDLVAEDSQIEATLFRESWNNSLVQDHGRYRYHSTRLLERVEGEKAQSIAIQAGKGECQVKAPSAGPYVLRLRDTRTGSVTTHSFYAGYGAWEDNISRENPEKL